MRTNIKLLMRMHSLRLTLQLSVIAFVILSGVDAHAYDFWTCSTGTPKWDNASTTMYISTTDFPPGSVFDGQLKRAMTSWNNVAGSVFTFYWGQDTDGAQIDNNRSEIYYGLDPDPYSTDELAATWRSIDCYTKWTWSGLKIVKKITDMDIFFKAGTAWSDTHTYLGPGGPSLEGVALHELGHAIGFDEENGYNLMATMNGYRPNGGPIGSAVQWDPFGDDRMGVRYLYPDGTTERDIAASPYKPDLTTTPGHSTLVECSTKATQGENISMEYTISNLGTQRETFHIGFYLSTDDLITTSDILLGTVTGASLNAGETRKDRRDDITIPAWVTPGTYYLGFIVDYNNAIAENNETNNNQHIPKPITIDVDAARLIPTVILPLLLD